MKISLIHPVCIVLGLSCSFALNAQETVKPSKTYFLKCYLGGEYVQPQKYIVNGRIESKTASNDFLNPMVAVSARNSEGRFTEFQLNRISWGTDNNVQYGYDNMGNQYVLSGAITHRFNLAMTMERGRQLWNLKERKLKCLVSFGVMPFVSDKDVNPKVSQAFTTNMLQVGAKGLCIPRLQYMVSKKLILDLNVPLPLISMELNRNKVQNPQFSAGQQVTTSMDFNVGLNALMFRFGMAYKL